MTALKKQLGFSQLFVNNLAAKTFIITMFSCLFGYICLGPKFKG